MAELLRWPRQDTLLPASSVVKVNQVERPRDSRDDLDLATDVRLLRDDVAWAKGAPVDDAEAAAGYEHSAIGAARATLVIWHAHDDAALAMVVLVPHCLFSSTS